MKYLFALIGLFILVTDISKAESQSVCQINNIQKIQKKSFLKTLISTENNNNSDSVNELPKLRYQVINKIPHVQSAYTEGFLFQQNFIYESIGLIGLSALRKIDPANGKIVKQTKLSNQYFGEGIAMLNNKLIQFTLKKNTALVYDSDSLVLLNKYLLDNQNVNGYKRKKKENSSDNNINDKIIMDVWGATNFGQKIMLSDGSSLLRLVDPISNEILQTNQVMAGNNKLVGMNEIEWLKGLILANIWPTDCIAVIRESDYQVVAWLDLSALNPINSRAYQSSVLNGIAYNVEQDIFYITGKYFPFIYKIKVMDLPFERQKLKAKK